jgi:hypothetical protein
MPTELLAEMTQNPLAFATLSYLVGSLLCAGAALAWEPLRRRARRSGGAGQRPASTGSLTSA